MNLKRLVVEELLANVSGFLVSMNVEHPDVELPQIVKLGALRLSPEVAVVSVIIGHKLAQPIPDLNVDDEGITATLAFNFSPYLCHIPWDAIVGYAEANGRPTVAFNPESEVPMELRSRRALLQQVSGPKQDRKPKRPTLRLVKSESVREEGDTKTGA